VIASDGHAVAANVRSIVAMSTIVSIETVVIEADHRREAERAAAVARAFDWFLSVESSCSRFDEASEIVALSRRPGEAVRVGPIVLEAVRFALAVAEATGGAFDPAIGAVMADRGFDVAHQSGARVSPRPDLDRSASYRDVEVDEAAGTITLHRPLLLGAVAKGLAVDLAARELTGFDGFAIDAGGDLLVGGTNAAREPWALGIRHPRQDGVLIERVRLTDRALCTSGDYERRSTAHGGHHILDPRTGTPANGLASVSVVAPTALVADALATAAFVLGPRDGLAWLEDQGVDAVMFTDTLERLATPGW
jgi:thiamine biosynthesis lipoprotein